MRSRTSNQLLNLALDGISVLEPDAVRQISQEMCNFGYLQRTKIQIKPHRLRNGHISASIYISNGFLEHFFYVMSLPSAERNGKNKSASLRRQIIDKMLMTLIKRRDEMSAPNNEVEMKEETMNETAIAADRQGFRRNMSVFFYNICLSNVWFGCGGVECCV